jgi:3-oxoacyl-[acyl-carrier-protein] synthase II
MNGKRVVVTGLGAVSPLGNDLETNWTNLLAGKSGVGPITRFDASGHETRIAGEVRDFSSDGFIPPKQARRMDDFTRYAVVAAMQAMQDAGWPAIAPEEAERVGVLIGCGLGGLETIETYHKKLLDGGPGRISPFFIPILIANMAAGQVSIFTGAKGPNLCTTSACASGLHAIGYAASEIALGRADAMICGGTESTITPLAVAGFNAMKALSTRNDEPERASRPFDKGRDGFVIGEGCGLLILESLDRATARGARILAEVVGFGASADAYHIAAPEETGSGMARAMRAALADASLAPEAVDHVNAHATSTPVGDIIETRALKTVFGQRAYQVPVTANKSQMGHLLGAAGGVESVFSVLTIARGVIPGTINLDEPDPECDLDYVAGGPREQQVDCVLCNSFGFGGTNASILYKRYAG